MCRAADHRERSRAAVESIDNDRLLGLYSMDQVAVELCLRARIRRRLDEMIVHVILAKQI